MPHPYLNSSDTPRVLAHRGLVTAEAAARSTVENSLAAIAAAAALQANFASLYVESDCHLTRDGEVVLCHDEDLTRVLGDPRRIDEVSVAELRELMRDRGELATLAEVLDAFPNTRFNIDVKAAAAAVPMGRIVAPHADRVLVTSFSDPIRRRALRAATVAGGRPATSPGRGALIRVLLALATRSRWLISCALAGLDALQIPERHGRIRVLSPRLIDAAHEHGVEVHVWTINDPTRMQQLIALGVDGVVTDRADVAIRT